MGVKHADDDHVPAAAGARVRRLDRRHDDRRRDHGRAVPPRAHRRGHHRRRLAARHRPLVDGRGDGPVAPARHARGRRRRTAPTTGNPLVAHLPRQGRPLRVALAASRPARTGPSSCELDRPPRAGRPTSASPTPPPSARTRRRRVDLLARGRSPSAPLDEWREALDAFSGQWTSCRTPSRRPPTRRPSPTATSSTARPPSGTPFKLAAAPVQFGGEPPAAAPGARVQRARRRDPRVDSASTWTPIIDLKVRGVVA